MREMQFNYKYVFVDKRTLSNESALSSMHIKGIPDKKGS